MLWIFVLLDLKKSFIGRNMKKLALKICFLAFVVFGATVLLGENLYALWAMLGDPEEISSMVVTGSIITIFAGLGIIVVRTILGILSIVFVAVLLFIILKTDLFNMLLQAIQSK